MSKSSESVVNLNKALVAFQAELTSVSKDSENPYFSSKFASLAKVVSTAAPVLTKHGLAVMQILESDDKSDLLTTRLAHVSGEWIEGTVRLHMNKNDAQSFGSAASYARRYAYQAILGLVAEDDDDGNAASVPPKRKPEVSELEAAKQVLRQAIKAANLSKEQTAEYSWVATATDDDLDRIRGLSAALSMGKAVG